MIVSPSERILVTGATGFLGSRVVSSLLNHGFGRIRCFTRWSSDPGAVEAAAGDRASSLEIVRGNLLSREDCERATQDVALIYHLAASTGAKSYPEAFMNSVVTTRNLLEAAASHGSVRRFVSISSFAVYTNRGKRRRDVLDESCPVDTESTLRGEAYCFAKVKQDELVVEHASRLAMPYVLVRPGVVYGPGKTSLSGRIGSGAFGVFLHLGGSNIIPLTYVDNCADAIVQAGLAARVDGEVFNVVDDDLPTSRQFLKLYKRNVRPFRSIPIPRLASYALCAMWEKYSDWSEGQLPPVFNRRAWHAYWKGSRYSNAKLKRMVGWTPRVSTPEGLRRYFASCQSKERHAA
jgi:nucleoside-diphosphate-sugar epimerase